MRRPPGRWAGLLGLVAVVAAAPASARRLFEIRTQITSGGASGVVSSDGTNHLADVPDLIVDNLLADAPFDPLTDDATTVLDVRGLPAILDWSAGAPALGDERLSLVIPGVIEPGQVSFGSGSLERDVENFVDWLQGRFSSQTATDALVTDFLQAVVLNSPVDPVAGNPNSLFSRMTEVDYLLGQEGPFEVLTGDPASAPDQTGLGAIYGDARGGGFDVELVELDLDHRFNLKALPSVSPIVSLPLAVTFTEGQWSVLGSFGLGGQWRVTDFWALTPMGRVGAAGSIDVGAAALAWSATLTSQLHFDLGDVLAALSGVELGITNQGGYVETPGGIQLGDIALDYDLGNGVFRNGGYLATRLGRSNWGLRIHGHAVSWTGDDFYVNSSSNVGASIVGLSGSGLSYEWLRLGVSYVGDWDRYNGFELSLRFRF